MADQEAAPSLSSQDDSDASLPSSTSSSAADTTSRIHYGVGDAGGAGAAPFAGSNTTPQSPYEVLLTQVTALQTDLSKTFAVCQQLRAENDTLSENYYRLKDEQGSLREKYSDTRRRFYDEQKLRMDIEQKHDDVVRSWKVQLDSKAQEFMELQAQMAPPRDLELLRMKIQEEFEVPHQEKVARLEAEVAKYREMFYNVRREHELLRTEYEQFSLDAGKREESLHASHLVVVNQLRAKLAAQAENHDDSHAIDEIRRLERTSGEQVVKIEALEHEVDDLRRAKEAAVVARDTAHLETARENTELLASVKTLEARAQNAEAHAASLSVQVERTQRRISEQQKRVGELDHELSLARREVERKEIERQDDDAAYAASLLKTQDDANIKLETITSERDSALKRIRDLQWELQAARATVESRDRAADQAVALAKKDAEAREKAVVIERTALEKKLASCEEMLRGGSDEVAEMEKLLEQEREAHQATRRTAQQDVERERMRAGDLEEAHRSVLSQAEERSAEHAELQIEYNRLRSEHRELRAKEQALVSERQSLESTAETLEEEMATMSAEHEKVALDHLKAIHAQEETFKQEIKRMQELSTVQVATVKSKMVALRKEKQKVLAKSEKYKEKALKEHALLRQARLAMADVKSENDAEVSRLKSDVEHLTSRLREIERSRDILLMGSAGGHPEATAQGVDSKDRDAGDTIESVFNDSDGPHGARAAELNGYMEKLRSL